MCGDKNSSSLSMRVIGAVRRVKRKIAGKSMALDKKGALIIAVIAVALTLNVITFVFAYPDMFKPSSPTLARDFSAYYIGGWRLFHNPTKAYAGGSQPGDYPDSSKTPNVQVSSFFLDSYFAVSSLELSECVYCLQHCSTGFNARPCFLCLQIG